VHVIISIITKIALLLLISVLTALILLAWGLEKKRWSFRNGTLNNTCTAAIAGAGILMAALIRSLVKTK
jgi:formate hydrogenlyase subunit 4